MNIYCNLISIIIVLFSSLITLLNCDRIESKIYKSIESKYFCFRRLNATNQIGCNSKEGGNVGVIYIISNETDFDYVLKTGVHYPYVAVIPYKHFNLKNMMRFKSVSDRISGILVLDDKSPHSESNPFSPDKSCPNEDFDLYVNDSTYGHCKKQKWNIIDETNTKGIMYNDWQFPIYLIKNQTDIKEIEDCFSKFGGPDWPLCAIELVSPMNAAKNAVTCMRRTHMQKNSYFSLNPTLFCDPLGGTNIFNTLFNISSNVEISKNSTVVLAARLDSFSMFDDISPGADSAISSLVTLLSIAHTLSQPSIKNDIENKAQNKNLLFALFDGEAFDYIGSSRAVYDMTIGKFPVDPASDVNRSQIRTEHFSHFIELNQLGFHGNEDKQTVWIHKNVNSTENLKSLENIIESYAKGMKDLEVKSIPDGSPLPPSSLQSFLKHDKSIVGVVIANHEKEYTNKFYNSFYDDINNINKTDGMLSKRLANIATVISKSIYEILTGNSNSNITVDQTIIEQLLECYLNNAACDLFRYVGNPGQKFPDKVDPYPTYVNVYHLPSLATYSRTYTHLLLSYLTGYKDQNKTKDECIASSKDDKTFSYYWMAGSSLNGTCIISQALKTAALSPAFINDDEITNSTLYSTWTESQWRASSARLFIKPSALQQWMTLITGLIILCVSFYIVYFIDKKSSLLFESCVDIVPEQSLTVGC